MTTIMLLHPSLKIQSMHLRWNHLEQPLIALSVQQGEETLWIVNGFLYISEVG